MKSAVSQKESSLGMRIYLYIIGLVCLSANVWLSYDLDKHQQTRQIVRTSPVEQDTLGNDQENRNTTLVATATAASSRH